MLVVSGSGEQIGVFAGTGAAGQQLKPDPKQTEFRSPWGLATLSDGRALIIDSSSHRAFMVSGDGSSIEPFAGSGADGYTLHTDPLTSRLRSPWGVAVLPDESVLMTDRHRVLYVPGRRDRPAPQSGKKDCVIL